MIKCLVLFVSIAFYSANSTAQENAARNSDVSVGLGVAIGTSMSFFATDADNNFNSVNFITTQFQIPIRIGSFRIEPEIGYNATTYNKPFYQGNGKDES